MTDVHELAARVAADGFAIVRDVPDVATFERLACTLGTIVVRTAVQLRSEVATHLCQPAAVPLHTDHPAIDVVGWWCEAQDERDGASILVDAHAVLEGLSHETVMALREALLPCPQLLGATSSANSSHPVLRDRSSQQHLYFAGWLAATGPTRALAAHRCFGDALELMDRARREVRLASLDAIFVDNHRMLHGRRALEAGSRRLLRRVWITRRKESLPCGAS